jgi:hypothetical protein
MILYSQWLALPIHTRIKIADQFGILKKGSTHVVNNEVQSDGYLIKEVESALSIEALQAYTGTTIKDHAGLFDLLVAKIEGRLEVLPPAEAEQFKIEAEERKVATKPKKKNAKQK